MRTNWYKVATILLSGAMVLIMFVTGIYYRAHDSSSQRIAKIEEELEKVTNRKSSIEKTPTVSVELLTLEKSGLPSSAFSGLDAVPAVIRLEHVRGETAEGISLRVRSYARILEYLPDASVEESSYEISDDRYSLRVDIPKLRRDSKLQGTIRCSRVSRIDLDIRIDNGVILQDLDRRARQNQKRRYLTYNDLTSIDPAEFVTIPQIETALQDLSSLIKKERGEREETGRASFWSYFTDFLITIAYILIPMFGLIYLISRHFDRKSGEVGQALGDKIGKAIADGRISIGTPIEEVRGILGVPGKVSRTQDTVQPDQETWEYEPAASRAFGWQPDIKLTFKNGVVTHVEFTEYGERQYDQ